MEQTTLTQENAAAAEVSPAQAPYEYVNNAGAGIKKNEKHTGLKVLAVLLCLLVAASTVMSTLSFLSVSRGGYGYVDNYDEDVAQENDVTIAGEFVIRSTKQISDAYISGDASRLSDRDKETLQMASDVLSGIITDDMTDYEKEVEVYKWLTTKLESDAGILTVIPTSGEESDNPYGVLKYRSAVCVGYATTFRLFMQMLGIECMVCHDTGLGHSWDLVRLDDGWYHTDCYFDSPNGTFRHFNMSDDVCSQDHDWNMDFFPEAHGLKYNYMTYNCVPLEDIYAIPQWLKQAVDNGDGAVSCKFENGIEDEEAAKYMVEYLSDLIYTQTDTYVETYWTTDGDENYVLCAFLENYGGFDDYDLSDEELERIRNAVSEAFDISDFDFEEYEQNWDYADGYGEEESVSGAYYYTGGLG